MRSRSATPSVNELFASPELGVLAVLQAAIDIALVSLIAAHPDDEPDAEDVPIERRAAYGLVHAAHGVTAALERYRLALVRARDRDRDLDNPF